MQYWNNLLQRFVSYLQLEKALSDNTTEAYKKDILKLIQYISLKNKDLTATQIDYEFLLGFLKYLSSDSIMISERSQARILSGLKSFFLFLQIEDVIDNNPTTLIEAPRVGEYLPDVLSVDEINSIIDSIDLSKPDGHRNKAIIEVLYGSGLRVSELIELRISNIYFDEEYIKVLGKGEKERLVPMSEQMRGCIKIYINECRSLTKIDKKCEDYLFLNRFGKNMTRISVFNIVKNVVQNSSITKNVSPHTFRHSFASHLVEGGADLRAVQMMLGHSSILTTEIYTHLDKDFLRDTIINFHPYSSLIR